MPRSGQREMARSIKEARQPPGGDSQLLMKTDSGDGREAAGCVRHHGAPRADRRIHYSLFSGPLPFAGP